MSRFTKRTRACAVCARRRLLRALLHLGSTVFHRPEHSGGAEWGESGGRYLLVLFSDYVFHQTDERGRPVLDHGHLVQCLHKLDAADPEQILLTSRDARTRTPRYFCVVS